MTVIQRSTTIRAPAEKIFDLIDTPERAREWAAGLTRVTDVQRTDGRLGDTMRLTYSVLGLRFPMKFTIVEYERPNKMISRFEGGMNGTMSFILEQSGDATQLNWEIDYTMRGGTLGKVADTLLVERMNERNSLRSMEDIKLLCESS